MAPGGKGGGLQMADKAEGGVPGAWRGWSEMEEEKPGHRMPPKSFQHPPCTPRSAYSPGPPRSGRLSRGWLSHSLSSADPYGEEGGVSCTRTPLQGLTTLQLGACLASCPELQTPSPGISGV